MAATIRAERAGDEDGVRRVNEAAFGRPDEAALVDALRAAGAVIASLVAADEDGVVGHILFSPATLTADDTSAPIAALGPMAVLPERQGQGIGGALVRAGLAACRAAGYDLCIVLGHAEYYPRFGFRPSAPFGIRWERNVPAEVFMVAELAPGALAGQRGIVRYRPEFDGV